jgi:hypothetical protein
MARVFQGRRATVEIRKAEAGDLGLRAAGHEFIRGSFGIKVGNAGGPTAGPYLQRLFNNSSFIVCSIIVGFTHTWRNTICP